MLGVGHDDGRPAVFEDVGDLVAVKASIDRHGHETSVPDGEQRLEVLGPIAHHDGDPVTGRQAEVVAQPGRRSGGPGGERAPAGVHALAVGHRRVVGPTTAVTLHPYGRVHRAVPPSKIGVEIMDERLPRHGARVAPPVGLGAGPISRRIKVFTHHDQGLRPNIS